ncbi:hypothetical protein [Planctomycetes bacterium K23_9]|uniref:Polysaccharide biosynthesis/export protein n=1 Tax=Stieleria marina TaxID=1930275 RepID=A0A517NN15_9BACT|nr:hypothetical protein K239x_04610 [Planctomycetes bacterium K23_9]
MTKYKDIQPAITVLGAVICVMLTGCTGLRLPKFAGSDQGSEYVGVDPSVLSDGAVNEKNYYAVRQALKQNAIVLNVQGDSDPVRILPLPSEGESVLVSDLLRQSGVLKSIGAVDVVVFRHLPPSPTGLRLPVRMNGSHEEVRPETDYALRPGDRIQVSRYTNDMVQSLLSKAMGL